jgi:LCP family protein required for cell wall assembly
VAGKDKPYKLYRGGRVKGPVRPLRDRPEKPAADGYEKAKPEQPKRRRRLRRGIVLGFVALIVLFPLVWALLGYLAVRQGVSEANERLDDRAERALTPQQGSMLSSPSNILVLGADVGDNRPDRPGPGRADTIMLIRTDPDSHRIAYLAIPRDLLVPIPDQGEDKINSAFPLGGPALAIDTVEAFTGLEVNHVIVLDFASFRDVVDALGGITIVNPSPILSNRFECPYPPERCRRWKGWRFARGEIELNGLQSLAYSRVRQNQLNPSETDITRAERQQRVVQAIQDEVVSVSGFLRMPFIGDDVVKPLATDLSTNEVLQLAWVMWRRADDATVRCRLGGEPVGGALRSSEDNALVVSMFTGESAVQRPRGTSPFEPGCFAGRAGS